MKLKDKVALVTGTSPNIGGGLAEALAAEGAAVGSVDASAANANDCAAYQEHRRQGARHRLRRDRRAAGHRRGAEGVRDFRPDRRAGEQRRFLQQEGRSHHAACRMAQADRRDPHRRLPLHQVRRAIDDRPPGARQHPNIVSTAGHQGEPNNIAYSTAKCGMLNFTRSAAMEFVKHGIRVNSLTPTATDPSESSERAKRWGRAPIDLSAAKPIFEMYRSRIPMQKLPSPSDYGRAAVFIVSSDADMMTGTDLRIDAGAIARYWPWDPTQK